MMTKIKVELKPEIRNAKRGVIFTVTHTPLLPDSSGGEFVPYKVEVWEWRQPGKERARVQVTGQSTRRPRYTSAAWPGSATFTLYGYENYRPCPDWLISLVREAGYDGRIDGNPAAGPKCWCGSDVGFRDDKGFIDCLADRKHDWRSKELQAVQRGEKT